MAVFKTSTDGAEEYVKSQRVIGSRLIGQLITMEKTATDTGPRPTFEDHKDKYDLEEGKTPGHHNFGARVSPIKEPLVC